MAPSPDSSEALREQERRAFTVTVARSTLAVIGVFVVYFLLPLGSGESTSVFVRSVVSVVLLVAVVAGQTYAVLHSETPALKAIEALSISIVLLLVTAASVYLIISGSDTDAFTEPLEHIDALYLSMMTMTTVGFGDIGALSTSARIAVMAQLVLNVIVLGLSAKLFLARARGGVQRHREID